MQKYILLFSILCAGFLSGCGRDLPFHVDYAEVELSNQYRKFVYRDSGTCDSLEIKGSWVVFCHPKGVATGGLFEVFPSQHHGYLLLPVNGKASSHVRAGHISSEKVTEFAEQGDYDAYSAIKAFEKEM